MIKVSVLYPHTLGGRFDIAYYCQQHMAIVRECLGDACKGIAVDHGLASATPGEAAPFAAMGHLYFDSLEDFQQSFGPHAQRIMGDLPNFTDSQPLVQISEVKLAP
ncbi:EthD family reductase [Pseudomonas sp. UBA2684]|mgnify:CR=1 FL=1|uniref:EthD family reductase n=1 Tax=Pseudomonas sp. UBA2684 TaxID=1947311 RepID=UPI000E89C250|nr:EthD family reductase [Pseudomonas sp. UBA2684]HBX56830.1 EthD family reductase [Pseudomonas sp.]|tara:strand:- start:13006 stop:13323 length:318 start_codon:yes stop_codon:yes gene_type:complete